MKKIVLAVLLIMVPLVLAGCDRSEPTLKGIEKTVKVQCGSEFNLDDFINENLKIKDETDEGTVEYKLKELEYEIECDETIYNAETGRVKTGDYGTYDVELTVKDESHNKAKMNFKLFLNPVEVKKGYYMFSDESAEGSMNAIGYCEITNTSKQFLKLSEIEMQFLDKEGVVVYETDMPEYAPEYLASGDSCYAMDAFAGWDIELNHEDDIAELVVNFKYDRDKKENDTTLEVGTMEINRSYNSNESGFAATATVTNPYDKGVDMYSMVAGLYDSEGNLIGVMDSLGNTTSLAPKGKGKATVAWLPASGAIPDKTAKVKGKAYIIEYEGK